MNWENTQKLIDDENKVVAATYLYMIYIVCTFPNVMK